MPRATHAVVLVLPIVTAVTRMNIMTPVLEHAQVILLFRQFKALPI